MKLRTRRQRITPLRGVRLAAIGIGMAVLFAAGGAREMMQSIWEVGKASIIIYKETEGQNRPPQEDAGSRK